MIEGSKTSVAHHAALIAAATDQPTVLGSTDDEEYMPAAVARLGRDSADRGAFQADAVAREIKRPEAVAAGQADATKQ